MSDNPLYPTISDFLDTVLSVWEREHGLNIAWHPEDLEAGLMSIIPAVAAGMTETIRRSRV